MELVFLEHLNFSCALLLSPGALARPWREQAGLAHALQRAELPCLLASFREHLLGGIWCLSREAAQQ